MLSVESAIPRDVETRGRSEIRPTDGDGGNDTPGDGEIFVSKATLELG